MTGSYLRISDIDMNSSVGIISDPVKSTPTNPPSLLNFPALGVPDFGLSESSSEMASSVAPSELPEILEEGKV